MSTHWASVVRVSAEGTFDGEEVVNVFHFSKPDETAATAADIAALLALLDAALVNQYSLRYLYEQMDSGLTISRLYGRSEAAVVPHESERATSIAGTNAYTNAPPMLAWMVKWRTDIAARRNRGRTYIPGVGQAQISTADADRFDSTQVTNMQTRVTNFVAAWDARTDWDFGVWSRADNLTNPATIPFTPITSAAPDPIIRIQRRRRQLA